MSNDMKKLKKAYLEGIIVPGRTKDGTLTLKGQRQEGFVPMELEEFLISAFEEHNATIDPDTLKFVPVRRANMEVPVKSFIETVKANKQKERTKKVAPETVPEPEPPQLTKEIPEQPVTKPKAPKKKKTWTKTELEEMPWQDLRALASKYEECNGMSKKADFIKTLTGLEKID